ncbi:CBS domain-containing protein [bacterium]|nr:MAG: CBS domain-containing protein [bacterium]
MFVGDRMSYPVITITPAASLDDAWRLMNREHISRLPVVDNRGHLLGIVSLKQLLRYMPSEATTLDVYEIKGAMNSIKLERIMTRKVITVTADTPIEEAARIMVDNEIGGIPVVEGDGLVGIITETDVFKTFIEVLGAREPGIRLSVGMQKTPGQMARLTQALFDAGANILSMGTFLGHSSSVGEVTLKVDGIEKDRLVMLVTPLVEKVIDVRETQAV